MPIPATTYPILRTIALPESAKSSLKTGTINPEVVVKRCGRVTERTRIDKQNQIKDNAFFIQTPLLLSLRSPGVHSFFLVMKLNNALAIKTMRQEKTGISSKYSIATMYPQRTSPPVQQFGSTDSNIPMPQN